MRAGIAHTSVAFARDPERAPLVDREAVQEAPQEHQGVAGSPDVACSRDRPQQQEAAARSSPHPRKPFRNISESRAVLASPAATWCVSNKKQQHKAAHTPGSPSGTSASPGQSWRHLQPHGASATRSSSTRQPTPQEALQEHQRVPGSPGVTCSHMVRQQREAAAQGSPHPRKPFRNISESRAVLASPAATWCVSNEKQQHKAAHTPGSPSGTSASPGQSWRHLQPHGASATRSSSTRQPTPQEALQEHQRVPGSPDIACSRDRPQPQEATLSSPQARRPFRNISESRAVLASPAATWCVSNKKQQHKAAHTPGSPSGTSASPGQSWHHLQPHGASATRSSSTRQPTPQEALQEHQRVPGSPGVTCSHMVRQQQEAAAQGSPHPRKPFRNISESRAVLTLPAAVTGLSRKRRH